MLTKTWEVPRGLMTRDEMREAAPEWLVKRGCFWSSGTEVHVLTTLGVQVAVSGDILELVPDDNFGTAIKIVKPNGA